MQFRLYTSAQNSAGERVRIALNLKQIPYTYISVSDLTASEYAAINPQLLMPTLEADGRYITQSLAIIDYLEDIIPVPTVLPVDPIDRAQARAFAQSICAELHALTVKRVRKQLSAKYRLDHGQVADWYAHWTHTTFRALERMLADRSTQQLYCFADYPTIADIALVPQMANARRFECDLSEYPLLREVDARCQDIEAFRMAQPSMQPDY